MPAEIDKAKKLVERGKIRQAEAILAESPGRDPEVIRLRRRCRDLHLRKYQRQNKLKRFRELAGDTPRLALAAARLAGPEELAALAETKTEDAELASASLAADPAEALRAWRRDPRRRPLAEGWLLILRGRYAQAAERFAAAEADFPRRARLGRALTAALAGDRAEADDLFTGLGPFPRTVFPRTAALLKSLKTEAAHEDIRPLLRGRDAQELKRTLQRPELDHRSRALLLLRLGDLAWMANDEERARGHWFDARQAHGSVAADVAKRYWQALPDHCGPKDLRACDRALRATGRDAIADHLLEQLAFDPTPEVLDLDVGPASGPVDHHPAWQLLWLARTLLFQRFPLRRPDYSPPTWKVFKAVFAQLDEHYAQDERYWQLRMQVFSDLHHRHAELRKCAFALLRQDPHRYRSFLAFWICGVSMDRRAHKASAREWRALLPVFGDQIDFTVAGGDLSSVAYPELRGATDRMPKARAAIAAHILGQLRPQEPWGGNPLDLDHVGRDEQADLALLFAPHHPPKMILSRLLTDPLRLYDLLVGYLEAYRPDQRFEDILEDWLRHRRDAWQPYALTAHAMLKKGKDPGFAYCAHDHYMMAFCQHGDEDEPRLDRLERAIKDRLPPHLPEFSYGEAWDDEEAPAFLDTAWDDAIPLPEEPAVPTGATGPSESETGVPARQPDPGERQPDFDEHQLDLFTMLDEDET